MKDFQNQTVPPRDKALRKSRQGDFEEGPQVQVSSLHDTQAFSLHDPPPIEKNREPCSKLRNHHIMHSGSFNQLSPFSDHQEEKKEVTAEKAADTKGKLEQDSRYEIMDLTPSTDKHRGFQDFSEEEDDLKTIWRLVRWCIKSAIRHFDSERRTIKQFTRV